MKDDFLLQIFKAAQLFEFDLPTQYLNPNFSFTFPSHADLKDDFLLQIFKAAQLFEFDLPTQYLNPNFSFTFPSLPHRRSTTVSLETPLFLKLLCCNGY